MIKNEKYIECNFFVCAELRIMKIKHELIFLAGSLEYNKKVQCRWDKQKFAEKLLPFFLRQLLFQMS
jgi:hypothetical protein